MMDRLLRDLLVSFLFVGIFFGASSLFAGKTHRSQPRMEQFIQGTKNEVIDVLKDSIQNKNSDAINDILKFLSKPKPDSVPGILANVHAIDERSGNYATLCFICKQTEFQAELINIIVAKPDVCCYVDGELIRDIIDHMPKSQRVNLLSNLNDGTIEWIPIEIRYTQEEIQQLS